MNDYLKLLEESAKASERVLAERQKLIALPKQLGYATLHDLISALQRIESEEVENATSESERSVSKTSSNAGKFKIQKAPIVGRTSTRPLKKVKKQKGRIRYDDVVRDKVKEALIAKAPAAVISKQFGPSVGLINAWKKEWGLTRSIAGRKNKKKTAAGKSEEDSAASEASNS